MHIAIVSLGYPYGKTQAFPFVKQIAEAFADKGLDVSVVATMSVTKALLRGVETGPFYKEEHSDKGSKVNVYRPKVITVGNFKIGNWSLNTSQIGRAVTRTLKKINKHKPIDVVYGHFWDCAYSAYPFAKKHGLPLFVANGESEIGHCRYEEDFHKTLTGVICVSSKCKNESIKQGYIKKGKPVAVIPNAIDISKFYHIDKEKARKEREFPKDEFIVGFTGYFIHRKGANRVSDAITKLGISGIKSIFLGSYTDGDKSYAPTCDGILFQGGVDHSDVAKYLNCADVFCLPTLNEGCCNAIVEAMACGLPIISNNLSFNDDILTDENSIRIDPMNIGEISAAIKNYTTILS